MMRGNLDYDLPFLAIVSLYEILTGVSVTRMYTGLYFEGVTDHANARLQSVFVAKHCLVGAQDPNSPARQGLVADAGSKTGLSHGDSPQHGIGIVLGRLDYMFPVDLASRDYTPQA